MVDEILTGAGFKKGETYAETRFLSPPHSDTFAVYLDTVTGRGADGINLIEDHAVSIELYESYPDNDAEVRLETEFNNRGIEYTKQARFWIESEQLYQVIYDINYTEKRSVKNYE